MASKRTNVLVYTGNGSTVESVRHCLWTLRRLLSPNYAVLPVDGSALLKEPWSPSCALLVLPGGADLGYCRTLNGAGNRAISAYVSRGGAYLGFCAGGYYGAGRCEFALGDPKLEVVGERELAFFPGVCRGAAFPGFVYHSEEGARAAELSVHKDALAAVGTLPESFRSYYNGGGVFVDAEKFKDRGVEVLASYTEKLQVDSGAGAAAVVYRKVGEGSVILTGPHPEFAAINLTKGDNVPHYASHVVKPLAEDDKQRTDFLKACLLKLGLRVNQEAQAVPSLSRLHLSSSRPEDVAELVASWADVITVSDDGEELIEGENDTFHLEKPALWSASGVVGDNGKEADTSSSSSSSANDDGDRILDYDKVVKRVVAHETTLPSSKETPYWNHHAFFGALSRYSSSARLSNPVFGQHLLYGEVVTSTNTLLEKNPKLLKHLPMGFTATATTQLAGRGRGTNVWVSPPGSLMYSVVLTHPASASHAPVVFVQYLAALATVIGAKTYEPGYASLPLRLKWPNDIYALHPSSTTSTPAAKDFTKIGGVLVNSSYAGGNYTLVAGVGVNVANAAPTTSLDDLAAKQGLQPFRAEKLLASILAAFEGLYGGFLREGWAGAGGFALANLGPGVTSPGTYPRAGSATSPRSLQDLYLDLWLHREQIITLEAEGGVRARVKGITSDWGLLLVEELGWEDRPTGKTWALQSDSNSFDFFRGLVRRKV